MRNFIKTLILCLSLCVFSTISFAAEVTLTWNPVDFDIVYSDPALSGYIVYKSHDNGDTKTEVGRIDPDVESYTYSESQLGPIEYYLTAFNQYGESDYSAPALADIGAIPGIPDGVSIKIIVDVKISP